ncbi:diguanylate phosphodiesterase [Halothece sp. PCC 7418]|uniref:EAL domain-containing protein n=1 Tax=Halothece sp. (strain PCC 7418) TaxID=65093 RepID=UPI0002A07F18|nr:EAL domain-containing protein [Halothece sp. PCC 7418]AFZ42659.1 diguanylate phosphodiesterase [Halothece sp. PCC 7418]
MAEQQLSINSNYKKTSWTSNPEAIFERGTFELWYQPVYDIETGAVLYNEVLLRWRDEQEQLHLPPEFLPILGKAGLLARVDALVMQKALLALSHNSSLQLSVNLSQETLGNREFLEELELSLQEKNIDPKRLRFEITESAIAQDFSQALTFLTELKNLGCLIVLDDFASHDLSLAKCEALPIDTIKLNQQFLKRLQDDPKSEAFAKATLSFCQSLGQVTAKFITDESTLKLVQAAGFHAIQGNHLHQATAIPEQAPLLKSSDNSKALATRPSETITPLSSPASKGELTPSPAVELPEKPQLWRRILTGTLLISMGSALIGIGAIAFTHRASRIIVDNGVVNGRVLRLRSPIDGTLEAFYPRPGTSVRSGQVLMQIGRSQDTEQALLQLQGEVETKKNQLLAAQQSLAFLQSRLTQQESEYERLWTVENEINRRDVRQKEAGLEKAQAQEKSARLDYERFRNLRAEGAIAQQVVDQAESTWRVAQAEVQRAQEDLSSTETAFRASQERIAMNRYPNWGDSFVEETTQLRQQIQDQTILINTLRADVRIAEERLRQAQSQYSDRQALAVTSPLDAVVYSTESEQGETVNQSEQVLTLLDCNELWAEAVISAEAAARINPQKPVLVELGNSEQAITGELELIQGVSPLGDVERSKRLQVQALVPSIAPELVGKSLSRVKVMIPPPPAHKNTDQFCGLGKPTRLTFSTENKSWQQQVTRFVPRWVKNLLS